jgi:hypothetical protein
LTHTVLFTTIGPIPSSSELDAWLTEQGEPYEYEGAQGIRLRALPMRLIFGHDGLRADIDITPDVPLIRLVRLVFDLSLRVRGDVRLASHGAVSRTDLWARLADEQDRRRIERAVAQADDHNQREALLTALWSVLCTLGHGQDLRWDTSLHSVVEIRDVSPTPEFSDADPITEDEATPVGTIAVPVEGQIHMLAWRWLSDAYPSLARH